MKGILSLIFLFVSSYVQAQNLVINPSFEEYEECPASFGSLFAPDYTGTFNVTNWYRACWGTSDYFNACVAPPGGSSVPATTFGYQNAKEGDAFAGGASAPDVDVYQEYIQGKLTSPLIAGHKIYTSFWTVVASHIFLVEDSGVQNIGMLFTNDYVYEESTLDLPEIPQVVSPPGYEFVDTVNWEQVSGTFTADGGEAWITIGGFPILGGGEGIPGIVYLFYDDVCVLDLDGAPSETFVHDTSSCMENPVVLSATEENQHYFWDDASELPTRTITTSGTYWLRTIDYDACRLRTDTFHVSAEPQPVPVNLGNDTFICNGQPLYLDASDTLFDTYTWSTGASTASIEITQPGLYYVTATSQCYLGTDTIFVKGIGMPEVVLPKDTIVCKGTPVELSYYQQEYYYQWSTGSNECCITVSEPGTYSLTLTNVCGESEKDDIEIIHTDCNYCVLTPTAFSPNNDGLNDLFEVQINCPMKEYRLSIFNRWGQIVFSTVKPDKHWDGLMNGKPADLGVYFYYIEATPSIGGMEKIRNKGDVTLVR